MRLRPSRPEFNRVLLAPVTGESRFLDCWPRDSMLLEQIHHPNLVRINSSLEPLFARGNRIVLNVHILVFFIAPTWGYERSHSRICHLRVVRRMFVPLRHRSVRRFSWGGFPLQAILYLAYRLFEQLCNEVLGLNAERNIYISNSRHRACGESWCIVNLKHRRAPNYI